jgi:hypothetical protein
MRFKVGDTVVDVLVDIDRFKVPIAQFFPEAKLGQVSPHALSSSLTMWI